MALQKRINTLLQAATRMGVLGSYLFSSDLKYCSTVSFQKKNPNFEGLQIYERHENHMMMS